MKNTATILREGQQMSDGYEYYADAERTGEITRSVYFRACAKAGLSRREAEKCLRENYQRAGLGHLF